MARCHVQQLLPSGLTRTVYRGTDPSRAARLADDLTDRGKRVRATRDGLKLTESTGRRRWGTR
jgi:(2Fe-2S) ferredoxin